MESTLRPSLCASKLLCWQPARKHPSSPRSACLVSVDHRAACAHERISSLRLLSVRSRLIERVLDSEPDSAVGRILMYMSCVLARSVRRRGGLRCGAELRPPYGAPHWKGFGGQCKQQEVSHCALPCDPYLHALARRPPRKARPFVS